MTKLFETNFSKADKYLSWVLGFIWADGWITENSIFIQIVKTDMDKLLHIFNQVGIWGIHQRNQSNRQPSTTLYINNRQLVKNFINLDFHLKSGGSPKKILKIIPEKYHYMFYKGISDGDGSFYLGKNLQTKQYLIGSTYDQDWKYITDLYDKLSIKNYKIARIISKFEHKSSYIRICAHNDIIKFGDYIYQDNIEIGLFRKYSKFMEIKNIIPKNKSMKRILKNKISNYNSISIL